MMIHLAYPYAKLALGLALFSGACSGPIKPGEELVAELNESEAARAEEEAMGPLSNFDKYQRPNPWVICIVPQSERDPKAIAKSKFMLDCERYNLNAVGLMASEWLSQWWVDQDDAGIQAWLNNTKRGMNLNDWKDFRDSRKMAIYRDLRLWDQMLRAEENAAGVSTPPLLWVDPLVTKLFERMKDESESCGSEGAR